MLIGLPPLLGPELLYTLRSMGHGDELAIVDGNYPAQEHARRLIRTDGHDLLSVVAAVLTVLPLDTAVPHSVFRTALNNDVAQAGDIHRQIDARIRAQVGVTPQPLPGDQFYARVRAAHTVVATSEAALFANLILRKGVIAPTA